MKRIAALDLIRGIAAFSVAVPHYLMLSSDAPAAEVTSVLAVEIFFALSGFVLAPQILFCMQRQHRGDIGIFLVRRWMRTIPPYLFALILISAMVGELFSADFCRYAFYVQNLFRQANLNDYYSIAWSLSVEEWFYVSLPAIMFVVLRFCSSSSDRACALVAVGFIAAITLLRLAAGPTDNWGESVRRVVIFRVDSIAYGFLLYVFVRNFLPLDSGKPGRISLTTATVLLGLTALIAFQGTRAIGLAHGAINQDLYPLYAAAFALSVIFFFYVISPWLQQSSILSRSSSYLGRISYSVYLFHILFAQVLDKKLAALPMGLQLAIYLSAVAVFCTAFYYFFERPILAARPRYRSAHEPLPEPDVADQGNSDGRLVAAGSQ
jgi:peptidoglycan/LPS O-acetylase OafA/YrhL